MACADCPLPYVRTGSVKVSNHWIRSPLTNIAASCQACRPRPEEELKARVKDIQDKTALLFRVDGKRPELWDPVTGAIRDLPQYKIEGGRTSVDLAFEPHQSFFVLFRKSAPRKKPAGLNFPQLREAGRIEGSWDVAFDPKWGGP